MSFLIYKQEIHDQVVFLDMVQNTLAFVCFMHGYLCKHMCAWTQITRKCSLWSHISAVHIIRLNTIERNEVSAVVQKWVILLYSFFYFLYIYSERFNSHSVQSNLALQEKPRKGLEEVIITSHLIEPFLSYR